MPCLLTGVKANVWYTEEHFQLQQKVRRLYRKHLTDRTPESEAALKIARRKYRLRCRKSRKKKWQSFTSFTQNEHSMAKLAELVQHKERKTLGSLQRPDGSITSNGLETLQVLIETHFPYATPAEPQTYGPARNTPTSSIQNTFSAYVSPLLTKRSLRKFKPYKAPGPDALKPIIFRHLPWEVFVFISFLYDCCLFFWYRV